MNNIPTVTEFTQFLLRMKETYPEVDKLIFKISPRNTIFKADENFGEDNSVLVKELTAIPSHTELIIYLEP